MQTLIALPEPLETAIAAALREVPTSQWMSAARGLSERYRADREGAARPLARGGPAALGYAALILPAAYAQLSGAMAAVVERIPGWRPESLLDLGSGPGTALWAAAQHWPSLGIMTAWEREPAFVTLGRRLAAASPHAAVRAARWEQVTFSQSLARPAPQYDLVVLGHLLNELDAAARQAVVAFAWEHCRGLLLIVEPGTSATFPIVRGLREFLLDQGAHTIAPCAHDRPCPLTGDWCHFPQRLTRPGFQRRAKEATAGWEESKFSYAAMARFPPESPIWGRLIHQPYVGKGGVELTVSAREGIVHPRVAKRDRVLYREFTAYRWGEALLAAPLAGTPVEPRDPSDPNNESAVDC
jgi:ribosomal protein RSM22 (predicted rRNA methylase)